MPQTIRPKVDFVRQEVQDLLPKWTMIRDCLEGSFAIKAKRTVYLVMPNSDDLSAANVASYNARLARAVFYNVTGRTHSGLIGQVFAKAPSADVPPTMAPFLEDVDGAGVTLDQQAKRALGYVLAHGRAGLLVDYPTLTDGAGQPQPTTRKDLLDGNVRPTFTLYEPWNIVNWRHRVVGSKTLLSLVVILEQYLKADDGFEPEYADQYRVLRLGETGEYEVAIYQKLEDSWTVVSLTIVRDAKGQPLKEIPFTFIGSENNEPEPDLPPLLDMAILNVAHFGDSADYQDSLYTVGQPTYVFSGLTEQWVKNVLGGSVRVGSSSGVMLPPGASAQILQANPNTMAKEGMEHKERQMKALGAKLVEEKAVQRTATEAGMEEASETSILTSSANNVSAAYTFGLRVALAFIGEQPDDALDYALNTDLQVSRLTSQDRAQLIAEWQGGGMDWEEYRWNMRRAGLVFKDDDVVKEEVAAEAATAAINAQDNMAAAGGDPNNQDPNA